MALVDQKQLTYLEYYNRENGIRHHAYNREMEQYCLLRDGDERAIEESVKMWESGQTGHIVDDPVKNMLYLCVASVTLATRFAIEGGMDSETAYSASDLYIRKFDRCRTVAELRAAHKDMFTFFTCKMSEIQRGSAMSKAVLQCIDYIRLHLHERITLKKLAEQTGLSPSYLSVLFARETGVPVSEYIMERRIETAKNMLAFSELSSAEIASTLAFSSQSHFSRAFREQAGMTPGEYRKRSMNRELFAPSG